MGNSQRLGIDVNSNDDISSLHGCPDWWITETTAHIQNAHAVPLQAFRDSREKSTTRARAYKLAFAGGKLVDLVGFEPTTSPASPGRAQVPLFEASTNS